MRTSKERKPRSAGLTFTDELALAVVEGTKTETRRPLHRSPNLQSGDWLYGRVTFIPGTDGVPTYRFMLGGEYSDAVIELSKTHKWTPAIHAPRDVAPFRCKLAEVIYEPIQNITEEQAKAEGVGPQFQIKVGGYEALASFAKGRALPESTYRIGFRHTWDDIYGERKGLKWDDNPMVRVYRWKDIELHESLIEQVHHANP